MKIYGLITVIALATASVFAQAQKPQPLVEALNNAGIFNLPDPTPMCVTPQQTTTTSVEGPTQTSAPQMQQVGVQRFCLQSNGLITKFRVEVSDPYDVGVEYYIQNVGTPSHVESFNLGLSNGQQRPIERYNRFGSVDINSAWLYMQGNSPDVQAADLIFDGGNTLTFSFANSDIGNEGRPASIAFYVYDKRDGQAKSVFPTTGYVAIPATLTVSLSPSTGTTLPYFVGQQQLSYFQLVAAASSTLGPSQVNFMWLADDTNNVTDMLNAQAVSGIVPVQAVPAGQPMVWQFTRRINYGVQYIHPNTKFRVTALSPAGVAYDEVVYNTLTILEPPSGMPKD